jgi:monothiol glutaredoxin
MSLSHELHSRIESTIASNPVVLFMKGTRRQPQCGFSAAVVGILDNMLPDYVTVNVLEDPAIREGIKEYSQWPTIPQLYVNREFVGGCDVVKQMYASGELHRCLGLEGGGPLAPRITVSDAAAKMIREALAEEAGAALHLGIDAHWNHEFSLAPAKGHEVRVAASGIEILLDFDSAQRASGLEIDMVETEDGAGISIRNPNAPPPIGQMSVETLKAKLDAGEPLHLFDVRGPDERVRAHIEGSRLLDDEAMKFIGGLPRDALLVFHCHTGARSQSAAERFRRHGYTNVHNLAGGIEAWSLRIDPRVPRY